jgi:TPR repeat protein
VWRKNKEEAMRYHKLAAAQGHAEAQKKLDACHKYEDELI